jgi:hypothetical protein
MLRRRRISWLLAALGLTALAWFSWTMLASKSGASKPVYNDKNNPVTINMSNTSTNTSERLVAPAVRLRMFSIVKAFDNTHQIAVIATWRSLPVAAELKVRAQALLSLLSHFLQGHDF